MTALKISLNLLIFEYFQVTQEGSKCRLTNTMA